jgi:asparagine synthase (glutamine-hydrolysing)
VFDQVKQSDERPFIEAVLAQNSVEPHYVHADRLSPFTDLDRVQWHQDEALGAGNLYIHWSIYGAAKERGVRVILDGFDGDTTVSHGTGYLIELARAGRWLSLAREVRGYSQHFESAPWPKVLSSWVWYYGLEPLTARPRALRRLRSLLRALVRREARRSRAASRAILQPGFAERIGWVERRAAMRRPLPQTEREDHYRRLTWAGIPHLLETLNKAAGAFAVEPRFPFFDKRLVEFCLSLPPEQKLSGGWNRVVMRRAMNGLLPEEVQWRGGKANMQPSFNHGLLKYERERLDQVILKDQEVIQEYVDQSALRGSYRRYLAGVGDEGDMLAVWRAVSLAGWLQRTRLVTKEN